MKFLISAFLLTLVAATARAEPVTLNGSVAVSGSYVRLGDLFRNTGDKTDVVVAYAPAPGKQAVFDAGWLYRVAQKNRLSWRPLTPRDRAVVRRDSYVVTRQEIEEQILNLLREQGEIGDMQVFLSNRSLRLHVADECRAGILDPKFVEGEENLSLLLNLHDAYGEDHCQRSYADYLG